MLSASWGRRNLRAISHRHDHRRHRALQVGGAHRFPRIRSPFINTRGRVDPRVSPDRQHSVSQPCGEINLGHRAGSQSLPGRNVRGVVDRQPVPVHQQEGRAGGERRPLVAVDEGMVLGEPERVAGGEVCNVWVAIGPKILGSSNCALQQALITDARRPKSATCRSWASSTAALVSQRGSTADYFAKAAYTLRWSRMESPSAS